MKINQSFFQLKYLLVGILFIQIQFGFSQEAKNSALYKTIMSKDSLLFDIGFNTCDIKQFENEDTWKLALNTINELDYFDKNTEVLSSNRFRDDCIKLVYYIDDNQSQFEKKTTWELRRMEESGEIFNSNLFTRLFL